ncbi:YybS family protein [Synergistaceae bacterium OttesenSCG-928-D05]|nr:YybS family protein [Synergistaceae bacterium OttesenSCG-928-D05]
MYAKIFFEWTFWILFSVLLLIAGMDVTLLATFTVLIAPAPFFILERKQGMRAAALGLLAGGVLVYVIAGSLSALIYVCAFGLLGLTFGLLAGRIKDGVEFTFAAIAASILLKVVMMILFVKATGINPFVLEPAGAHGLAQSVAATIGSANITISPESVEAYAKAMVETASVLMPAMMILFAVVDTMLSCAFVRAAVRKRGGQPVPSLPPFGTWRFPKNIFWVLAAALAADILNKSLPDDRTWLVIAMNLREVLRLVFVIEGLALCWYYMTARRMPKAFKYIFTVLCVIMPPTSSLVAILGSFDIIFDFRNMMTRRKNRE